MGITLNDIRRAFLGGGDVSPFFSAWHRAMGDPPVAGVSSLARPTVLPEPTVILRYLDPDLASLLDEWLLGIGCDRSFPRELDLTIVGLAPYGRNISSCLERIIDEIEPDIVAIDTPTVELSANMLYSFGIPGAVSLPMHYDVLFKEDGRIYTEGTLYPGNIYQTAIVKCWLAKIPLIPVGMPSVPRRSPSGIIMDAGYLDRQLAISNLLAVYHAFDESLEKIPYPQEGIKLSPQIGEICSRLNNALRVGMSEKIAEEASYIASRLTDVGSLVRRLGKRTRLLAIVDLKHHQDTSYCLDLLRKGIMEEVYLPPSRDVPATTLTMASKYSEKLQEYAQQHTPEVPLAQELFSKELEKLSRDISSEQLPESEVDSLIAAIVSRIREHPNVVRGASVRGAIAFKEVLQGFGAIQGGLTRSNIEKAALVTLPPRISSKRGNIESASEIVSDIVKEILYGIRFSGTKTPAALPDKSDSLSPEDITKALQNLTSAQLSQEQKRQSAKKGQIVIVPGQESHRIPSEYASSENSLPNAEGKGYSFSKEAIQQFIEELEQKLRRGEIAQDEYLREKSKLEEMLNAASQLPSQMSRKELAETVTELMDAKDKWWRKELDFRDMYVYYHIKGTCEGKELIPAKRSWHGLRVVIDYLQKRGILKAATTGKSFTLTGEALGSLLEYLAPKAQRGRELRGLTGYGKAQLSWRNNDIRRYTTGDVFRDISVRHTLREIAKKKKKLANINRRDFKVFMRQQHKLQSDIILCMDSSGSMGFRQKLVCARLVAAGLARAALENGNRVGLVTFDDLGRTVLPLTSKREEIFNYIAAVHAGGNTNIGDGIECATQLLLRQSSRNQKYIVLITDGQPSAISQKAFYRLGPAKEKDLSEESAIFETRRASSSGVRVSVIHVTEDKEVGREFVRNIAKAGNGQVRTISTADLRLIAQ
jgi:Mg-chelatase subunit ChlD